MTAPVTPGCAALARPVFILPIGVMDSGFALRAPRNDARRKILLQIQSDLPSPVPFPKIFPFPPTPNQIYIPRRLVPLEGRVAIVTDAGRDAMDAGGAKDEVAFLRTAKSCGPDTPTLVSSS